MYDIVTDIITAGWQILGQMAPYLLFGFLAAGILSVYILPEWIERHLGGTGAGPVLKASLLGVPLPLCSCSVIPVAASMHRHGASKPATAAFLLSTPQTGVDSIAVTYALLGPVFAIFRPIAALLTGLVGGYLVQLFDKKEAEPSSDSVAPATCCAEPCCLEKDKKSPLRRMLSYGFVTLPGDIGPALVIGIVIAAVISALVPQDHLAMYLGGGVLSIVLLMAAGVPLYVCATASVPLAEGFMHLGASLGAALAFLIAGPATNAATFTTIWKVLGRTSAILYIITVAVSALGFGLLLDYLIPMAQQTLPALGAEGHEHAQGSAFADIGAIVLLVVLAGAYVLGRREKAKQHNHHSHHCPDD